MPHFPLPTLPGPTHVLLPGPSESPPPKYSSSQHHAFLKIPQITISAAHNAYVSGAIHGAWRHTSDPTPKKKDFHTPAALNYPLLLRQE